MPDVLGKYTLKDMIYALYYRGFSLAAIATSYNVDVSKIENILYSKGAKDENNLCE